jgi:ABC-type Na+ efflux pump permease subunit
MTIVPIFKRELLAVARRGREPWNRSAFVLIMLAIVLGTFTAWYVSGGQQATNHMMTIAAAWSFFFVFTLHITVILDACLGQSARCIAEEKERRTLDFLLTTRLDNAEIILGKLAARMVVFVITAAAGLPVILLLNRLGGVDGWLIFLGYICVASLGFFFSALSIWTSVTAADSRRAGARALLLIVAWLWLPFAVAFILPRFGLHLPVWVMTANAWLLASSPLGLLLKWPGMVASRGFVDAIAWMCGLQVVGGLICLVGAIAQLRSAYRAQVSHEARGIVGRFFFPPWRFRPRPAVGDDPILWRERYTGRPRGLARLIDVVVQLIIGVAIVYPTGFFGWRALKEVWTHGYASGLAAAERPEFNLVMRFFVITGTSNEPADLARMDFNIFLRSITSSLSFVLLLSVAGFVVEGIIAEKMRETWSSLIATPLSAREILRAKILVAFWRLRRLFGTLIFLWGLGLVTGAIHPLGFVLTVLALCASTWFLAAWGLLCAIGAKSNAEASNPSVSLALVLIGSAALPFVLPAGFSSVLLGAGSPPFVIWLAQFSYRDLLNAMQYPVFPLLSWVGIKTGEGPFLVAATCFVGILAPALAGTFVWRRAVARFDRVIGRPWREEETATASRVPVAETVPAAG